MYLYTACLELKVFPSIWPKFFICCLISVVLHGILLTYNLHIIINNYLIMLKKRIYNVIRTNLHQGTHTENILINLTLTLVCGKDILAYARNWDSYLNYTMSC